MKLRIRGNSIRLRLTKEEVARFGETGSVENKIEFGIGEDKTLSYRLEMSDTGEKIDADFERGRITLRIPRARAAGWIATEKVGLEEKQSLEDERELRILVEKDFACLKPRAREDDHDAFPHPEQTELC